MSYDPTTSGYRCSGCGEDGIEHSGGCPPSLTPEQVQAAANNARLDRLVALSEQSLVSSESIAESLRLITKHLRGVD